METYEYDGNGQITITPFLRKVYGKDVDVAAEKLLDAILKELKTEMN